MKVIFGKKNHITLLSKIACFQYSSKEVYGPEMVIDIFEIINASLAKKVGLLKNYCYKI